MLLVISYDLKVPGRDYEPLYNAIKSAGTAWWHYLQSTWIVDVPNSTSITTISERLRSQLDQNDRLLVSKLVQPYYDGWLPRDAWDWIKSRATT